MFEKLNQKYLVKLGSNLIYIVLALWFIPINAGDAGSFDSPQAVFKAAQKAGAKKDFSALTKLVAPSERPMLALGTDIAVSMFVEFYEGEKKDEYQKKVREIQRQFGIKTGEETGEKKLQITKDTPPEVIEAHMRKRAQKLYGHVDAVKYVAALMEIMINMPEMAEQSFFPQEDLSDLKIDGSVAVGKAGEKTIKFISEGGRWYLTSDVMNE